MTITELIDALTALPKKERDVDIHVNGVLSGILSIAGIDTNNGYGNESDSTVYINTKETYRAVELR